MKKDNSKIVAVSFGVCHRLGNSIKNLEDNISHNKNGQSVLHVDDSCLDKELVHFFSENDLRRLDRVSKIGLYASTNCMKNSQLSYEKNTDEIGLVICTTYGAVSSSRDFINGAISKGQKNASPIIFPYTVPNAVSGIITIQLGVRGVNTTISGYNPVCYAYNLIKGKKAKAILTGGVEELTKELVDVNLRRKDTFSINNEQQFINPISEGAAMILLAESNYAASNNLDVLFEILGYGITCNIPVQNNTIDNFSQIEPESIEYSMKTAIERSEINLNDIGLVVSLSGKHGNQRESEKIALKNIYKNQALPEIYNVKDYLGENFGASDTFSLIAGYLKLNKMPKNKNIALINSYQIGGNITSLLINI